MTIVSRPLAAEFGVEVELQPHVALADHDREELRSLFFQHHLLVVHSQGMSVDETVDICGSVAQVLIEPGTPPEAYVSSARGDAVLPDIEIPWHADMNFNEMPHIGASLYAEEVDDLSTPTWYASASRAAARLPEDLRRRVEPLTALHEFPGVPMADGRHAAIPTGAPTQVSAMRHPLLWTHPVTGEPLIFISERQAQQARVLEDVDPAVERDVLDAVFAYLYASDNTYEHRWSVGDLVIWDNLAIQHRRASVAGRRTLRRLALVLEGAAVGDQYFRLQAFVKAARTTSA